MLRSPERQRRGWASRVSRSGSRVISSSGPRTRTVPSRCMPWLTQASQLDYRPDHCKRTIIRDRSVQRRPHGAPRKPGSLAPNAGAGRKTQPATELCVDARARSGAPAASSRARRSSSSRSRRCLRSRACQARCATRSRLNPSCGQTSCCHLRSRFRAASACAAEACASPRAVAVQPRSQRGLDRAKRRSGRLTLRRGTRRSCEASGLRRKTARQQACCELRSERAGCRWSQVHRGQPVVGGDRAASDRALDSGFLPDP